MLVCEVPAEGEKESGRRKEEERKRKRQESEKYILCVVGDRFAVRPFLLAPSFPNSVSFPSPLTREHSVILTSISAKAARSGEATDHVSFSSSSQPSSLSSSVDHLTASPFSSGFYGLEKFSADKHGSPCFLSIAPLSTQREPDLTSITPTCKYPISVRPRHLAISPKGEYLLCAAKSNRVYVWDVA